MNKIVVKIEKEPLFGWLPAAVWLLLALLVEKVRSLIKRRVVSSWSRPKTMDRCEMRE